MGDYNDAFLRNNAAGGAANVQSRVKAQARTNVLQLKLVYIIWNHTFLLILLIGLIFGYLSCR